MADELKPLSEGPAMCLGGDYGTNFQSRVSSGNCSARWFRWLCHYRHVSSRKDMKHYPAKDLSF